MNSNEHENETKGIYIPIEIASATDINPMDKLLYAVYNYYTQYGKEHSCYATNETLGVMLGVNERTIRRAKKNLLKQDLIEVSGNRYVRTKTDKSCTPWDDKADKSCTPWDDKADKSCTPWDDKADKSCTPCNDKTDKNGQTKRTKMVNETDKSGPHNKDNKELNKVIIKSDSNYNKDTLSKQDVNIVKSDSHQSENDNVNNNPLGGFEVIPDVPEWMMEIEPTEPFEQYTADIQGVTMEKTANNTFQADERKKEQTMKQTTPPKTKSWKSEIDKGYDDREQIPYQDRAEARKWYWMKWNAFITTLNERTIEDNNEYFKWFRTRLPIVTDEKYYDEKYNSIKTQYQHLFNKRWWDEWNGLITDITTNPQGYLACTRRYSTKAEHLKDLLKQMLKGEELTKHRLSAELKYKQATEPLLQTIKVEDPDTIGKDNSGFNLDLGISVETYNPSVYDAQTGAYYYTGE